jgi:hypothetical protein
MSTHVLKANKSTDSLNLFMPSSSQFAWQSMCESFRSCELFKGSDQPAIRTRGSTPPKKGLYPVQHLMMHLNICSQSPALDRAFYTLSCLVKPQMDCAGHHYHYQIKSLSSFHSPYYTSTGSPTCAASLSLPLLTVPFPNDNFYLLKLPAHHLGIQTLFSSHNHDS